ncbi:MAG: flagellar hook-basal body complex protein [Alphaproteobacteria bacterium]|nr:flagellar hook-basal body complex protein [Alphaproteobacteria bacterium]MBF0249301.1 flagellar hook-basal body complex protein [Alphaproteobacteria bacterium]
MALYGAFSSSMLGMMSQAASLRTIGVNISNVNTGGFKSGTTQFSTLLSNSLDHVSDIGGVRPKEKINVSQQGNVVATDKPSDVAISGSGFFILNSAQDGSGQTFYGRDGSFDMKTVNVIDTITAGTNTIEVKDGYLSDKNGYFVQGWAYTNGTVSTSGSPSSMRIDARAFLDRFEATTEGTLAMNIPADAEVGDTEIYTIEMVNSLGELKSIQLTFTKTGVNSWQIMPKTDGTQDPMVDTVTLGGTVEAGDTYQINIDGILFSRTAAVDGEDVGTELVNLIAANPTISAKLTPTTTAGSNVVTLTALNATNTFYTTASTGEGVTGPTADTTASVSSNRATYSTFGSNGQMTSPTTITYNLNFAANTDTTDSVTDGAIGTTSMTLDIANLTQFYGGFIPHSYTKDGFASSNMRSFYFDEVGNVVGVFEDNTFRKIYKVSLGVFANPNGLTQVNGNLFTANEMSGEAEIKSAGNDGYALFMPNAVELSNVDIAEEFTRMMMTQTAYNASSTVFKTTDEMTTVARDLKR